MKKTPWNDFKAWWKRKGYHAVFICCLLALSLLVGWWSVYINRSIVQAYNLKYESVINAVDLNAFHLGHNPSQAPKLGPFHKDSRLEIIPEQQKAGRYSRILLPYWRQAAITPTAAYLKKILDRRQSQRAMVIGESFLLLVLILFSGFMIYRMYLMDKRTTRELHEFWSRVSHEIKTPITGLKAFLETLRDQDLSREEMEPLLQLALKQVERQQLLAENMLVGQKLKRQGSDIQLDSIHLQRFLRHYFDQHSIKLSNRPLRLDFEDAAPVMVNADKEALRIIFDNITDNAVKYGGKNLELIVHFSSPRKNEVVIGIKDNGPGFDPAVKEDIFKAYRRLETELPRKSRGTGMGMHISRQLAREMGGELDARSDGEGTGAEFLLYLGSFNREIVDVPKKTKQAPSQETTR